MGKKAKKGSISKDVDQKKAEIIPETCDIEIKDEPEEEEMEIKSNGKRSDIKSEDEPEVKKLRVEAKKSNTSGKTDISLNKHKARLIVRNLSFKSTEAKLKKHFSRYGEISEVKVLKKPDGRLVGCGFVEFTLKQNAAKAIAHTSGQEFLGRPIVVDWAIPKDMFVANSKAKEEAEGTETDNKGELDVKEIKVEESDSEAADDGHSDTSDSDASGDESEGNSNKISKVTPGESSDSEGDADERDDSDEMEEGDSDELGDEESESEERKDPMQRRKPLRESHDLSEGCTVFVKNVPFSVDNQELRKCMLQFGHIYYALICIDPLTEHSKGTAFVKFRTKESADACLAAGAEGNLVLRNSTLVVDRALSREDVKKGKNNSSEKRDTRNLYLIKEGVILAGSPAAVGVSPSDMAKRLQLEQWKTRVLRNLHKFVSRNRLVIQNLPEECDDKQLRALGLKHSGKSSVVTEARVMRNLRNIGPNGIGKSKGFGFLTFGSHESALQALRNLNNNPAIFTPGKRPIVAFSIEDKKALNLRHKRLEKSKLSSGKSQKPPEKEHSGEEVKLSRHERRKLRLKKINEDKLKPSQKSSDPSTSEMKIFAGERAKPGDTKGVPRRKLQEQVKIYDKTLKKKNRIERKKKVLAVKTKQPKQKAGTPKYLREDPKDNFSALVNKYKTQLTSHASERKKWYE